MGCLCSLVRMESAFLDLVADRVVVYDGATGTWLQTQDLDLDDFGGAGASRAATTSSASPGPT